MIGSLFGSRKRGRSERPTFRPFLETLENREVPSSAQVSAAFNALPTDVANLQASLTARDSTGISNNFATVTNDLFFLRTGASGFVTGDRLRIDGALFSNGIALVYDGFNAFPANNEAKSISVIRLGVTAIEQGGFDFVLTSFFPNSSGDAVLT